MRNFIIFLMAVFLFSSLSLANSIDYTSSTSGDIKNGSVSIASVNLVNGDSFSICNDDMFICRMVIHLDMKSDQPVSSSSILGRVIGSYLGNVRYEGIEIYESRETPVSIPVYKLTLKSYKDINGTMIYYNESSLTGTQIVLTNITGWYAFKGGLDARNGTGYDFRLTFRRSNLNDKADLVPSIFGSDFYQWTWWSSTWLKKKPIQINSSVALTDYAVGLNITYDSDMKTDFSDLRFTNSSDNATLNYFIHEKSDSNWAYVWIKGNWTATTGTDQAYMYYNNSAASSLSSGDGAFIFYEDGTNCSTTIGTAKWETLGSGAIGRTSVGACSFNGTGFGSGFRAVANVANVSVDNVSVEYQYWLTTQKALGGFIRGTAGSESSNLYGNFPGAYGGYSPELDRRLGGGSANLFYTYAAETTSVNYTRAVRGDGSSLSIWMNSTTSPSYYSLASRNSTTDASFASGTAGIFQWGSGASVAYFDYFIIRKWTTTEPTYYVGTESTYSAPSGNTYVYGEDPLMCNFPSYIPNNATSVMVSCRPIDNSTGLPMTGQTINCQAFDSTIATQRQALSSMTERTGRTYTWSFTLSNSPYGDCSWINCTTNINGLLDGWSGSICRERSDISSLTTANIPTASAISYNVWQNINKTYNFSGSEIAYYIWQNINRTNNMSYDGISYNVWQNINKTNNLSASDIAYSVWINANRSTSNLTAIDAAYQVWQSLNRTYNLSGSEAAYYVWQNANRTNNLSSSDIAYAVWMNGNRSVNITNMSVAAGDIWAYSARALTNYNESYIVNQTWQNSFRGITGLTEDSIVYKVWQSANRSTSNLTAIEAAYQVWLNVNRTYNLSGQEAAYHVWQNANRTNNMSEAGIAYYVWINGNRSANISSGALTAADVWTYANRELTDYNESYIANITWNNPSRTLTSISVSVPSANDTAYAVWNSLNRTYNLSAQDVWEWMNRTLNQTEFLTAIEQAQLLNASQLNVSPAITINATFNLTFNNTYNQTSLMNDINGTLNSLYTTASVQATNVSTDLIFQLIFALLAIVFAFIALMYQRTILSLIAGALWVALAIYLYPFSLIIFICCLGVGLYLWVRIFIS